MVVMMSSEWKKRDCITKSRHYQKIWCNRNWGSFRSSAKCNPLFSMSTWHKDKCHVCCVAALLYSGIWSSILIMQWRVCSGTVALRLCRWHQLLFGFVCAAEQIHTVYINTQTWARHITGHWWSVTTAWQMERFFFRKSRPLATFPYFN